MNADRLSIAPEQTRRTPREAVLDLLADHLEAALAHGGALLGMGVSTEAGVESGASGRAIIRQNRAVETFIADIRRRELSIVMRLLQARSCADEAARQDRALKPLLALINAGTAVIADAAEAMTPDAMGAPCDTGGSIIAFLASRGLLSPEAAGMTGHKSLHVDETTLVLGRLPLGELLDMTSAALDAVTTA